MRNNVKELETPNTFLIENYKEAEFIIRGNCLFTD